MATGTIHKLYQAGFPVIVLETANPSAIRRYVAFSEAVYEGEWTVEGVTAVWAADFAEAQEILEDGNIPVLIDPDCKILEEIQPQVLIDAILAKRIWEQPWIWQKQLLPLVLVSQQGWMPIWSLKPREGIIWGVC